jgi:hypothetical protein
MAAVDDRLRADSRGEVRARCDQVRQIAGRTQLKGCAVFCVCGHPQHRGRPCPQCREMCVDYEPDDGFGETVDAVQAYYQTVTRYSEMKPRYSTAYGRKL